MTNVYDQHDKAFANVAAYIVARDGEKVARVAFKYPSGNATRVWAYVHWHGVSMVRGYADGGGYDKASAAVEATTAVFKRDAAACASPAVTFYREAERLGFVAALDDCGESTWDRRLRDAGFDVWQAV